jgi:integrase
VTSTPMLDLVEEYLAERRSLGFALKIDGQQLRSFARFADGIGHRGPVTIDLAVRWATLPRSRARRFPGRRLEIIRPFARYRASIDGAGEVPSRFLLGPPRHRPLHHIYGDDQVVALVAEAGRLRPVGGLRPRTYASLFALLSATGLRVSEALRLRRDDVDLTRGVLVVRATKFRKSRLVPLHVTAAEALRGYVAERDRLVSRAAAPTFFIADAGGALHYSTVRTVFLRLRHALGWAGLAPRPRIHDLRHTFACRRLRDWYAQGLDVNAMIASLATYLGHAHVTDTYWYLTGSPELLALAAGRFEKHADSDGQMEGGS